MEAAKRKEKCRRAQRRQKGLEIRKEKLQMVINVVFAY
jgi:hypothetical protein